MLLISMTATNITRDCSDVAHFQRNEHSQEKQEEQMLTTPVQCKTGEKKVLCPLKTHQSHRVS